MYDLEIKVKNLSESLGSRMRTEFTHVTLSSWHLMVKVTGKLGRNVMAKIHGVDLTNPVA